MNTTDRTSTCSPQYFNGCLFFSHYTHCSGGSFLCCLPYSFDFKSPNHLPSITCPLAPSLVFLPLCSSVPARKFGVSSRPPHHGWFACDRPQDGQPLLSTARSASLLQVPEVVKKVRGYMTSDFLFTSRTVNSTRNKHKYAVFCPHSGCIFLSW